MGAYKDKNRGTWYANFTYTDHNGEKKAKLKRGFATKREALTFEEEFLEKYVDGTDMKLKDFISEIYLPHMKQTLKLSSYKAYKGIIENHILPDLGNYKLSEIDDNVVIAWQNKMLETKAYFGDKLEQSTLHVINCKLSSVLNYAEKCYGLTKNPVKNVKSIGKCKPENEMKFWTIEQYRKIRNLLKNESELFCPIEVLFWTGMRKGEMFALTMKDVNVEERTITINKTFHGSMQNGYSTDPKTKSSYRKITIPGFLADEIREYIKAHPELTGRSRIFAVSTDSLVNTLQKYALLADIPVIRVHDLRHSHVSLLIDCGYSAFEIAQRVGHEAIDITYRYAHLHPRIETSLVKTLEDLNDEQKSEDDETN